MVDHLVVEVNEAVLFCLHFFGPLPKVIGQVVTTQSLGTLTVHASALASVTVYVEVFKCWTVATAWDGTSLWDLLYTVASSDRSG